MKRFNCGWNGNNFKVCCKLNQNSLLDDCGRQLADTDLGANFRTFGGREPKVWGGNATRIDEFPWMVLLEYEKCKYAINNLITLAKIYIFLS